MTTGTCSTRYQVQTASLTVHWYLVVEDGTTCPYPSCTGNTKYGSTDISYNTDYSLQIGVFLADPETLTVSTSGPGSGTVTSAPVGIACGPDCFNEFPSGYPVWLTAVPDPGSVFVRWAGEFQSSQPDVEFSISHATYLDARFELIDTSTPAPTPTTPSAPTVPPTSAPTPATSASQVPASVASIAPTETDAATPAATTTGPTGPASAPPPVAVGGVTGSPDPAQGGGIETRASGGNGFVVGLIGGGALVLIAAAVIGLWLQRRSRTPPAPG